MSSTDLLTSLLTTKYMSVSRKCESGLQDSLRLYICHSDLIIVAAEWNTTINIILISQFIIIADMLPASAFPRFHI